MIFHESGEMCWRVKVCYDRFSGSKIKLRNGWNMIKPSIWLLREVCQNIPRQASDPSKQDRQFQRPAGSPEVSQPCMTSTAYSWNCSMHFNIHICHSERKWKHSGHDSILFQHILCKILPSNHTLRKCLGWDVQLVILPFAFQLIKISALPRLSPRELVAASMGCGRAQCKRSFRLTPLWLARGTPTVNDSIFK